MVLKEISRREWIRWTSWTAAGLTIGVPDLASPRAQSGQPFATLAPELTSSSTEYAADHVFLSDEESFLEEVQRASFAYLWEEANPFTGLVKDRSQANGLDSRATASIAATGFALTALCVADHRGWLDGKKIRERVRNTLRFAATRLGHVRGFFFHFLNMNSGDRDFQSEISTIDSSIFFCGVLTCAAYFDDKEIRDLAAKLYERADWTWFLQGAKTLSMGWKPEENFLKARWDSYSELMMIYLLGLGSSTHPLPAECWDAWKRPQFDYYGMKYIGSYAPLFVHQYSHAWFDFRGKRDAYANYFQNSVLATKVHKLWCLEMAKEFPDYSEDLWGISASDSARGYQAWGGPPPMGKIDGSVVPCATAGSLPFLPADTIRVLKNIREKYGKQAWRKYGFVDALNPLKNWYNPDVLGIDAGITLLMVENARTGFIWEQFMKNDAARQGMQRAGFHPE